MTEVLVPGLRLWQAVVTLEALAPLTVGTGGGDDLRDSLCVTDANGLPTLPGSSIAGALRARWTGEEKDLFGGAEEDDRRSRLWIGWAAPHDARNAPVPYLAPEGLAEDPVLELLRRGVTRDHVRISPWGVADGGGKFDETLVPRGARFSFELRLDDARVEEIETLVGILRSDTLRLGGRTRRGYGLVRAVSLCERTFDLRKPEDRAAWSRYARAVDLGERAGLLPNRRFAGNPGASGEGGAAWLRARLNLRAEAGWRVGTGERAGWTLPDGREADLVPVAEDAIVWKDQGGATRGAIERQLYLPASAIKGALRHRTAYHLRCARGQWRVDGEPLVAPDGKAHVDGVELLFGTTKERKGTATGQRVQEEPGEDVAGCVYVDDVALKEGPTGFQQHVSLDRFTGGPLAGHLFSEAVLWRSDLAIRIAVDARALQDRDPSGARELLGALRLALRDLAKGRLPLGAAGSRGHGVFRGTVDGDLGEVGNG